MREGRGIFANIRKFLRFLLSSNIGEVLTMFFGVVLAGALGLDDTGEAIAVPLLATQILWINLLTDGAPALALGIDPPPDDVMQRPPRRLTDRVIDARDVDRHPLGRRRDGGGHAARARPPPPGGLVGGSGDVDEARTMAFTTLVLAQLFNCFNARSDRTSAFRRLFTNRLALGRDRALGRCSRSRSCSSASSTTRSTPRRSGLDDWLICVGLASVVLWADEAKKLVERRLRTRP